VIPGGPPRLSVGPGMLLVETQVTSWFVPGSAGQSMAQLLAAAAGRSESLPPAVGQRVRIVAAFKAALGALWI